MPLQRAMRQTQQVALVLGIVFLGAGIAGFVPAFLTPSDEPMAVNTLHGRLFGLFPVNILHDLFHVAFGVWGLMVFRRFAASKTYLKTTAIVYGVLIVAGFIPGLQTMFGLIPLHSHDIWLHALIAAPAAYFGFRAEQPEAEHHGEFGVRGAD